MRGDMRYVRGCEGLGRGCRRCSCRLRGDGRRPEWIVRGHWDCLGADEEVDGGREWGGIAYYMDRRRAQRPRDSIAENSPPCSRHARTLTLHASSLHRQNIRDKCCMTVGAARILSSTSTSSSACLWSSNPIHTQFANHTNPTVALTSSFR